MPIQRHFYPPKNWQDFEQLCLDIFGAVWSDPHAQLFGKTGSSQAGIDILGKHAGRNAAVQCRKKDPASSRGVTENELRQAVIVARRFTPKLGFFAFATTSERNVKLQKLALKLSSDRLCVKIYCWDDLEDQLNRHRKIARHYSELADPNSLPLPDECFPTEFSPSAPKHDDFKSDLREASRLLRASYMARREQGYRNIRKHIRIVLPERNRLLRLLNGKLDGKLGPLALRDRSECAKLLGIAGDFRRAEDFISLWFSPEGNADPEIFAGFQNFFYDLIYMKPAEGIRLLGRQLAGRKNAPEATVNCVIQLYSYVVFEQDRFKPTDSELRSIETACRPLASNSKFPRASEILKELQRDRPRLSSR